MIWLNGGLVAREQAHIDPADRGLLLADGLFETLRADRGRIFKLEEHLQRMAEGATELAIPLPLDPPSIAQAVRETLDANQLSAGDAAIRITLTRGPGQRGLVPPADAKPNLIVSASAYRPPDVEDGFIVVTSERARRNEGSVTARLKTLQYLDNIVAQSEASAADADEALLLNNRSTIACGARSNLFAVIKGKLLTPNVGEGALPGITRATVLRLAKELSMQVTEAPITVGDLARAEEMFLTNSLLLVMPVRRCNGSDLPHGPITKRLMQAYSNSTWG
jgi:branched-chain amino acid aminotransferase